MNILFNINIYGDEVMSLKRFLFFLLTAVFFVCALPVCGYAWDSSAKSAIVIEKDSGRVLYNKAGDWELPMASTTKIMTAYVALRYGNLNDIVEVSENAAGVEGSSMYLEKGEKITLENLLYGLMLLSGNDAAVAVAEAVGGSVDRFVEMMNETAADLGLSHTHFDNPNGLPSDTHYTTALELAEITRAAMNEPKFAEIVSTKSKSIPWEGREYNREMTNHNKLLSRLDGCVGVKTGYTEKAGRCLVSAVTRDGMTLICVTLNAPDDWNDHITLHNTMFNDYRQTALISSDEVIDKLRIAGGFLGNTAVTADREYIFPVSDSDDINIETELSDVRLPVKAGDTVGSGTLTVNGELYGSFELLAVSDINLVPVKKETIWQDLKSNLNYIFGYWAQMLS